MSAQARPQYPYLLTHLHSGTRRSRHAPAGCSRFGVVRRLPCTSDHSRVSTEVTENVRLRRKWAEEIVTCRMICIHGVKHYRGDARLDPLLVMTSTSQSRGLQQSGIVAIADGEPEKVLRARAKDTNTRACRRDTRARCQVDVSGRLSSQIGRDKTRPCSGWDGRCRR